MYRKTFEGMNCSVAGALEQVGEWWSLLIVRECTMGTTRFDDFQHKLGIARNVLTARLNRLIEHGVLVKVLAEGSERRNEYRLTEKGEALYPVLVALMQWGDAWCGPQTPIRIVEDSTGHPIEPVSVRVGARKLGLRDVRFELGDGATAGTKEVVRARNLAILGKE
ncbi:winged helix-turn-helix transcriptional regulator [Burkholderiaceae bacterium 16]|nr:HxlR family transcriptional regulator [Burkholderiaceae bacterium 16]